MKDVLFDLEAWINSGAQAALATVVGTWGSSPRGVGAKMGVRADGRMVGSVSGGCVEGAVIEAALQSIADGKPQLLHFGVADETAWEVGLACGGEIDVFVQKSAEADIEQLRSAAEGEALRAIVTVIDGDPDQVGSRWLWDGSPGSLPAAYRPALQDALDQRASLRAALPEEAVELFIEIIRPDPRLIIVGGVHISIALARIARILGYRPLIVDPRSAFSAEERFSEAERIVRSWPDEALMALEIDESTAVAILTHDPKLDDPALQVALRSQAFYVGALGSRNTQEKRRQRLLEAGLSESQLDRLHGPIGLDIGAGTPEEIALAVMGEIIAARAGASRESKGRSTARSTGE